MKPTSSRTDSTPEPADLALFSDVLRQVARMHRLRPEDADDFFQSAHCRQLERNYDVFRQFGGRSSLRTYLTVVAVRLLLDWRNSRFGKWRPSREAQKLGSTAVALERLMSRDGHTASEAVATLAVQTSASPETLDRLVERLPRRMRRRFAPESAIDAAGPFAEFIDPTEELERERWNESVLAALRASVERLPDSDRLLLDHRFRSGLTVKSAGEALSIDPKRLYRRLQTVLTQLRADLSDRGFDLGARAS
jgi:RNA polymerase sigma factor (sigma-70 family)